jgi:hypothetical protein
MSKVWLHFLFSSILSWQHALPISNLIAPSSTNQLYSQDLTYVLIHIHLMLILPGNMYMVPYITSVMHCDKSHSDRSIWKWHTHPQDLTEQKAPTSKPQWLFHPDHPHKLWHLKCNKKITLLYYFIQLHSQKFLVLHFKFIPHNSSIILQAI